MELFEIGGLTPQFVLRIFIFILCIRYIEQDYYYLVPFVNLFKLCYHFATITNPLNLNNLWDLKEVSFGLSSFLWGLLGTLEKFIENTFGVYVSMSLGDHGKDINGQDVYGPKKRGHVLILLCVTLALQMRIHSCYWKESIGSHKSMMDIISCKKSLELQKTSFYTCLWKNEHFLNTHIVSDLHIHTKQKWSKSM
jgi:hypothetical protein